MQTSLFLSPAVVIAAVMAVGCADDATVQPAYPTAPPPPPPPGAVYTTSAAAPTPVAEDDVVYDADPPVVNIETYPSVMYGGGTVYYVGGAWYRHGAQGWGRYRQEPAGLARMRSEHAGDARWAARPTAPRPAAPAEHREGRP